MTRIPPYLLCLAYAALFTFLFHGTGIGLNLLLFELLIGAAVIALHARPGPRSALVPAAGTILTAVLVVLHGSSLALVMNLISVLLTIGMLLAPELEALHSQAALAFAHLAAAQRAFLGSIPWPAGTRPAFGITPRGAVSGALLPLIVLLFATLYSSSNPYFGRITADFYAWCGRLDASLLLVFLLGLMLCSFILLRTINARLMGWAASRSDELKPGLAPDGAARARALANETRTGVLLLGSLNALLLLLNALDVYHVWFNFRFEGQYLKEFVHQGTWLLIVSILLGAAIVLYFFRGDQNFQARNRAIKTLSHAWLAQNMLLVCSVGVRNYWYIHYYALAYKRIGVAFFLLATVVGLVLIMLKIHHKRSAHYFIRWNVLSFYLVALIMTLFDWDVIIARYNVAHRERAFIELGFLASLSDKALPHLTLSKLELENLDRFNDRLLGGHERYSRRLYLLPAVYGQRIDERIQRFLTTYPERSWKEWNLADAQAFDALRSRSSVPK